jgi:hypothetical protein
MTIEEAADWLERNRAGEPATALTDDPAVAVLAAPDARHPL